MKKTIFPLLALSAVLTTGCFEDIDDDDLYTFTGETIEDYLAAHEEYSCFNYILTRVGYDKMLSSYGTYTCFAPSNDGVLAYVDSLWNDTINLELPHNGMTAPGLEGLTDSLCLDIGLFHLLYNKVLGVDLTTGVTLNTMINRDISTTVDTMGYVRVNSYSAILNTDIELENGIIHELDHVITRSNDLIAGEIEKHPEFSLFSNALKLCGLNDSLTDQMRKDLTPPIREKNEYIPGQCRLGYTIFAETDDVYARNGIRSLDDLIAKAREWYQECARTPGGWYDYYRNHQVEVSTGLDFTSPHHVLNMFLRYHIVRCKVPYTRLLNSHNEIAGAPLFEYYETLLPYTLLKVQRYNNQNVINRWVKNSTLTDRVADLGSPSMLIPQRGYEGIVIDNANISTLNGYIHPIRNVLLYDANVADGVLYERLRFDVCAIFDEMISNNIRRATEAELRGMNSDQAASNSRFAGNGTVRLPEDFCRNLVVYNGEETKVFYLSGQNVPWANMQGDEINCVGKYDFAMRLPPVPDGMYELRLGYSSHSNRGMVQIYMGRTSQLADMYPIDIPLDMRHVSDDGDVPDVFTGWISTTKTNDSGMATDADMRNRGFMRGPYSYTVGKGGSTNLRNTRNAARRILVKQNFEQGDYWLRFKTMLPEKDNTMFHLDYIELVPEDIWNNEVYAEDIY